MPTKIVSEGQNSDEQLNRAIRRRVLELETRDLEVQIATFTELERHYKEYLLDFDLSCYQASLESLNSKDKFMKKKKQFDELEQRKLKLIAEIQSIDGQILKAKAQTMIYENLDPNLLAEYRTLKDDLDVQEMLFKIQSGKIETKDLPSRLST